MSAFEAEKKKASISRKSQMRTATTTTLVVAALSTIVAAMVCSEFALVAHAQDISTLDVSGSGSVSIEPEFVRISVSVLAQEKSASDALEANNVLATNVTAAIEDLGIKDDDVTTTSIRLTPVTFTNATTGETTITGFRASNTLQVDVYPPETDESSLEQFAGEVLTTLVLEGVNTINSVDFLAVNTSDATDRARELAVKDARNTADVFADAAGYIVTAVQSIDVNDYNTPGPLRFAAAVESDAAPAPAPLSTPITAGDITVSSSVAITYVIAPNFAP